MSDKHIREKSNKQPSSTALRRRKLLLIVAGSRKRFWRDWQQRADRLMQRAIARSWLGRLAAYHRQTVAIGSDWRARWMPDEDGDPLPDFGNVVLALHEDFNLTGKVIVYGGKLCARGDPPRVLKRADITKTIDYLARLGLPGVSEETCREALRFVALEGE